MLLISVSVSDMDFYTYFHVRTGVSENDVMKVCLKVIELLLVK